VQIFDCGTTDGGVPYLVMELLEGEPLARLISRRGQLPEPEARKIAIELADILVAVHAAGIVHRDLKPDNIFCVGGEGTGKPLLVKVLDLGIAKSLHLEQLTRTGEIIGTAAYLSPEQCLAARSVGPRTDIYALGCILYEMITGRPPFSGNVVDLMQQHFSTTPQAPSRYARVSDKLEQIIMKCLRKRPEARIQTMVQLQRELLAAE
jgi:serine/threonine-protein kinase